MTLSRQNRTILVVALLIVAVGGGIAAYILWWRKSRELPGRDSPLYLQYQRAFQVGVAALDAGGESEKVAQTNLDRAIELIPEEPAGWANRGILHLRKNNLKDAEHDLKKAHELAPDSGDIDALLGLLAEKQGRVGDAVSQFRKAREKKPRDVAVLYALAQAVSKEGGANSQAEYQKLMEEILKIQPNNLPVLMERALAAHRNQDQAAFRDTLVRFAKLEPGWKEETRQTFANLRKGVDDTPKEIPLLLARFGNVLLPERGYSRDKFFIMPEPRFVGMPLQQFLRLDPMRATPAPPDNELSFQFETLVAKDDKAWDVVKPVWLLTEAQRAELVEGDAGARKVNAIKPSLFVANANGVRRLDAAGPVLPFPGGPKSNAPSAAGVLAVDWDNDFRVDLVLAGAGGLRIWQQKADGTFADVSSKTALPVDILDGNYYGVWAADLESDSDLDFIAARSEGAPVVLRNNGDGTFKAMEPFAGVKNVRSFAWADLDNDGSVDAVFLDAAGALHVFANDRGGLFSPWPLPKDAGSFLAMTIADLNADGGLDIVAQRSDGAIVRISDVDKRHRWEIAELARWTLPKEAAAGSLNLLAADMDNNGAVDLIVGGHDATAIFLADEQNKLAAPRNLQVTPLAVVDLDNDGRLDLLGINREGKPAKGTNQSKKGYRAQTLRPLANPRPGDHRINSFALGGEMEIRAGAVVQKQPISGPVVHFGLGAEAATDVARVVWPNGVPQWEFDLAGDHTIAVMQRLSGSCPFLFTFDGEGMHFAGDFMWGTPLGMYINGQNIGDFPQTTEWLKIPGKHLVPRDGVYDLRVHANLWETDYFDQLALIVVDHPPNTEVHVDERFFLTPTRPRLHVTTPAKPVARAWDHHGKEATDEIRSLDGIYLDRFKRGKFQGVAEDHWVEIDLGADAPREGPVLLVARGWLHPTNSSINVALSQGKHEMPKPLSLEVPDGNGGWKVASPALGFPAGKVKTMLIRLDEVDPMDIPRKVRLRTSMEIYWDFIGYAVELDPKLAKLQRPEMSTAELRYRGVVAMTQKNASSPEVPLYDKVILGGQPWRDLTGYHTRFGDVRELLAKVDDRYVIANAGDEIALRFPAPPLPDKGWQRDFIWECDGWTRDGDMNTRFGNTVLPLPEHGKNADLRAPTRLEEDPVYLRFPGDWRTYHTRYVTGDLFARGLRR